jgi:hypothetical protein
MAAFASDWTKRHNRFRTDSSFFGGAKLTSTWRVGPVSLHREREESRQGPMLWLDGGTHWTLTVRWSSND